MSDIETAFRIAVDAHAGQLDKSGEVYLLHPLRVMLAMETSEERIVALLHDVAEDSEDGWMDIDDSGFADEIVEAIDAITKRDGETYAAYLGRVTANPLARRVKLADIADNLLPSRRSALTEAQVRKYERALGALSLPKTGERE